MLASGTTLGPYRILAPLGAGGMGEVYLAGDTRLARDVALKVVPSELAGEPGRIQRFEQEARASGALNHPNVCAVHDIGEHEGAPFVVMELLEGETLRQRLARGPLPARKAIDFTAQVARGLAAAHEKGIFHRDLKPENLFVTTDGPATPPSPREDPSMKPRRNSIALETVNRRLLEQWSRTRARRHDLAFRADIVLTAAAGVNDLQIARQLRTTRPTVAKWLGRFRAHGPDGLHDEVRSGRPRTVREQQVAEIVNHTLHRKPADATHWSTRSLAETEGVSRETVRRIWNAFGLQPHRAETFKLSGDPLLTSAGSI